MNLVSKLVKLKKKKKQNNDPCLDKSCVIHKKMYEKSPYRHKLISHCKFIGLRAILPFVVDTHESLILKY